MNREVLIAGAGPTGLAAALFLAERGIKSRLVDRNEETAATSKALGVNPRTLELLEPCGVTAEILAKALKMVRMRLHQNGRPLGEVRIDPLALGARFPLVILPQSETERLLAAALAKHGIKPERGLTLTWLDQDEGGVDYILTDASGGELRGRAAILLGADGAHSAVRHLTGIGFPGRAMPEAWQIVDCTVAQPNPEPHGHVDFQRQGPWVALPFDKKTWRLIGPGSDLTKRLPRDWTLKKVLWRSDFHISHRVADKLALGRVCLAGDAAHLHSPLGARGMNLGIEDAYVFAACASDALSTDKADRLADYGRIRREVDGAVVRRIELLTRAIRARGPAVRSIRSWLIPTLLSSPKAVAVFTRTATGLDHPVRLN
jgi:2-polyprenyl-6-methoxyphenol hydroxylase-like FAD-dependent oxidoreductase